MDITGLPVADESRYEAAQPRRAAVTLELVIYIGLLLAALVFRVAELDTVPLTDAEARRAVAAWRFAWPDAPGADITPDSPLLFLLHSVIFSTLGGSEFTARFLTALAGAALVLSPALFRNLLGRVRALVFSALLAFSPVLLVASRSDSPVIWSLLAAAVGLWALRRYWETGQKGAAVLATICLGALLLLTDPTGPVLALMLLGGLVFAAWTARSDDEGQDMAAAWERLRGWPWSGGLAAAALVVVVVSTLFLAYPEGLNAVSALLSGAARGLTIPQPGTYAAFPVVITLFYEPALVLFGVVGAWWLARSGWFSFVERFFLGWLIFAAAASLVYAGAGAEQALWLVLPLAGLTARVAVELLRGPKRLLWYTPGWAKWALAIIMVGLLFVLAVHTQALGRALLKSPDGTVQLGQVDARSAVWVLVGMLFVFAGYFMAASLWGAGTAGRGWALGLLAFSLVTSLGSGWNAAVFRSEDPAELWHPTATSRETALLRQTLAELAQRETGGFPQIPITVLAPEDGLVAWLVRDYPNARFVRDVSAARGQGIVLLPEYAEPPNLGGSYVGQRFIITTGWNPAALRPVDFPTWWLQRQTRTAGAPVERMILWLRQDIYNGVPFDEFAQ